MAPLIQPRLILYKKKLLYKTPYYLVGHRRNSQYGPNPSSYDKMYSNQNLVRWYFPTLGIYDGHSPKLNCYMIFLTIKNIPPNATSCVFLFESLLAILSPHVVESGERLDMQTLNYRRF